jgi:hypothetical protein
MKNLCESKSDLKFDDFDDFTKIIYCLSDRNQNQIKKIIDTRGFVEQWIYVSHR